MSMEFVDLQVNGYAGADFNARDLAPDELHRACEQLRTDGVRRILATVITASVEEMAARLTRIIELRERDELAQHVIAGVHIEGPFISAQTGYVGAHPDSFACRASLDAAKRLLEAAGGLTKIVTLAPEQDEGGKVTRYLSDLGITVSAGHTDASLDQLERAIDAGLSMFTHLGNGCPLMMHRHDNIVQRVLSLSDRLQISFIADGAHIPLFALKNYLKLVGLERVTVVSDAIAAAGLGPGDYSLGDQKVHIGEDLVPWSEDRTHFVGSACPLPRMVENLRQIGLNDDEIYAVTVRNPAQIIAELPPTNSVVIT